MSSLKPIRVGDTFQRKYVFTTNDPSPVPIDISNIDIQFIIASPKELHSYGIGTGVTVTPLQGMVEIELTAAQTAILQTTLSASSYLRFSYPDETEMSRAHQRETIISQGTA